MTRRSAIRIKRVYDPPSPRDGARLLVDRLWPRGLKKEAARLDGWLKDVAPSDGLRRWFGHDPGRWDEFVRRYHVELDAKPDAWRALLERARRGPVSLLYAARDPEHNHALALARYLRRRTAAAVTKAASARAHPGRPRSSKKEQP